MFVDISGTIINFNHVISYQIIPLAGLACKIIFRVLNGPDIVIFLHPEEREIVVPKLEKLLHIKNIIEEEV